MFHLVQSNRIEELADRLIGELRAHPSAMFTEEVVVVPTAALGRWLSLRTANRLGIASGTRYPFPAAYVWSLIASVLTGVPRESPFDAKRLTWRIFAVLDERRGDRRGVSQTADVAHYLRAAGAAARFELAQALAQQFDAYSAYRPDWLQAWAANRRLGLGEHEDWQQQLWRRLSELEPALGGAHPMEAFFATLAAHVGAHAALPKRLSFFGLDALAPLYLRFFERLAAHVDVTAYHLNPCEQYWADIVNERNVARAALRDPDFAAHFDSPNPLFASLGAHGRALAEYFADRDFPEASRFIASSGEQRLARQQNSILSLKGVSAELPLARADDSVAIHVCHSAIREAEVLHDQLLARFDRDRTLVPDDVVILATDMDIYGNAIEAVFAAAPIDRHIPFSIADRGAALDRPLVASLMAILECAQSRFEAERVLRLLEEPRIARRFEFSSRDRGTLRTWVEACGIRWGIDASMRAALGLPAERAATWRAGLDRLILGAAMAADEHTLYAGIAPYTEVEGRGAEVAGRLVAFFDALVGVANDLGESRPVPEWCERIARLIGGFHALDAGDEDDAREIRGALEALATAARSGSIGGGALESLPAPVALRPIRDALQSIARPNAYLRGGVSVAKLALGRAVPARVVCVMGMSDTLFPRREPERGFDLIARHRSAGDRNARAEDRYAFLQALLAARDAFIVTYTGRGERDDAERPPATALIELEDALRVDGADLAAIVTAHPLRPFSPRYFARDPVLFSYAKEWRPGARAVETEMRAARGAEDAREAAEPRLDAALTLSALERIAADPVKSFLSDHVGIRLADPDESIDSVEAFELDPLARFKARTRIVAGLLDGESPEHLMTVLNAQTLMPPGGWGAMIFAEELRALQPFVEQVRALAPAGNRSVVPIAIDFEMSVPARRAINGEVRGLIPTAEGARGVFWKPGGMRVRGEGGLIVQWLRYLAANAAGVPTRWSIVSLEKGGQADPTVTSADWAPMNAVAAHDRLADWVHLAQTAQSDVVPLWPESALAYAKAFVADTKNVVDDAEADDARRHRAIRAAYRVWAPRTRAFGVHVPAESERAYNALAAREFQDPLDSTFATWAERLMVPLARVHFANGSMADIDDDGGK